MQVYAFGTVKFSLVLLEMNEENNQPPGELVRESEKREHKRKVAAWVQSVMDAKGLKATPWSVAAGTGRNTVARALDLNYLSIPTTTTLIRLAEAAHVPPPLDLGIATPGIPSALVLGGILEAMIDIIEPKHQMPKEAFKDLGRAVRQTLLELAEEPDAADDLRQAERVARISARLQIHADNDKPIPDND